MPEKINPSKNCRKILRRVANVTIKAFLKLVEIQTKLASMIPYVFGVVYTLYRFDTLKPLNVLFFFISLLSFDMFTTALNNYNDYRKAVRRYGYNYEFHNAIGQFKLKEKTVAATVVILFTIALVFGILTFYMTDYILLLLGALSFLMGILYSAGPIPISRTPLGEVFSGGTMGFLIPFLVVYSSIYDRNYISIILSDSTFTLNLDYRALLPVFLTSLPAVFCIANIMLANNTCDIDDDFENRRYTLPIHLGKKKSLILFDAFYILSFLDIAACVIAGYLPWVSIFALGVAFKVYKNVKAFHEIQTKKDTFGLSVMNMVMILVSLIVTVLLGLIIRLF